MKTEQINEAMAVLDGYYYLPEGSGCKAGWKRCDGAASPYYADIPIYDIDYNAVHRVLNGLDKVTRSLYLSFLVTINSPTYSTQGNWIQATPLQMCEAILKAKDLWDQPKEQG